MGYKKVREKRMHAARSQAMEQYEEGWVCPECHLTRGADLHDPCIGELPGVKFACCGHGGFSVSGEGYIAFNNGTVIRFSRLTKVQR